MRRQRSRELFQRAVQHIPGGVNSPSRSYDAVGIDHPVFMRRGQGAYLWDADGNRYLDYVAAYGALILGHAHPAVLEALTKVAERGTVLGTPHELEVTFAEHLKSAIPSLEKVRFVNSGTEAVMTAIRLARGATGRAKLVKFAGCYHGHSDPVLLDAGSGASTLGISDSAGIPDGVAADVLTIPYNDAGAVRQVMDQWGEQVAAILVEPLVGNFGIVPPEPGFLEAIHETASGAGALVIYDEVITAFRFHPGAIQDVLGFRPDITVLGKIIGGGLPIGAYGGPAAIMDHITPLGPVYQDGTFCGNPLSLAAGLAALQVLREPGFHQRLDRMGAALEHGLREAAARQGVAVQVNRYGGALSVHFTDEPVRDFATASKSDAAAFARFFRQMLAQGIHLAPSIYEAWFVTGAHTDDDIEYTLNAAERAFAAAARGERG
ncbi:MAG: glutamate-1-semialdehyde 2,1-aminomutase [Firmicutes bacterium]|nr:glutamate-1-semialdehyde 2,1-aminomutase [Bacillota bacterium]